MFTCAGFSTTGNRHSIIKSRRNEKFYLNWHVYIYFNFNYIFKANSSFFFTKINVKRLINDIDLQTLIRVAQTTSFSELRISLSYVYQKVLYSIRYKNQSFFRQHVLACLYVHFQNLWTSINFYCFQVFDISGYFRISGLKRVSVNFQMFPFEADRCQNVLLIYWFRKKCNLTKLDN